MRRLGKPDLAETPAGWTCVRIGCSCWCVCIIMGHVGGTRGVHGPPHYSYAWSHAMRVACPLSLELRVLKVMQEWDLHSPPGRSKNLITVVRCDLGVICVDRCHHVETMSVGTALANLSNGLDASATVLPVAAAGAMRTVCRAPAHGSNLPRLLRDHLRARAAWRAGPHVDGGL